MRLSSRKAQISIVLLVSSAMLLWVAFEVVGPIGGGPTTPVSEVTRGRFVHRIDADGVLSSEVATEITVPQGRRGPMYIGWLAEDGSEVREGDLLVQFDSTDLENQCDIVALHNAVPLVEPDAYALPQFGVPIDPTPVDHDPSRAAAPKCGLERLAIDDSERHI